MPGPQLSTAQPFNLSLLNEPLHRLEITNKRTKTSSSCDDSFWNMGSKREPPNENQPSNTNVKIFQNVTELISEWDRNETTVAGNPKYQYELIYKRDFLDNEDHTLIFSATGNLFTKEQSSNFENKTVIGSSTFNDQRDQKAEEHLKRV